MTIKDLMAEIRMLGLTCTYSSDWNEYTINYRKDDPRRTKDSDYKTSDIQDALDTAKFMAAAR